MSSNRPNENTGSSLPPPEIPPLRRPTGTPAEPERQPQSNVTPSGLPPAEIKPLTAPAPLQPPSSRRSGCTFALLLFAVLVAVVALLIWWFVLRPAL
jgi:hypothetical protein